MARSVKVVVPVLLYTPCSVDEAPDLIISMAALLANELPYVLLYFMYESISFRFVVKMLPRVGYDKL